MTEKEAASGNEPMEGASAKFWKSVADLFADVSADLEISGEVLIGLPEEDDWSFVVKTHALIETRSLI